MSESLALTLIAVGITVIAVCVLAVTIVTALMVRKVAELARRTQVLAEQLQAAALVTMGQVQGSARAMGQAATVAARVARPLVAAGVLRNAPPWIRRLSLWTGTIAAARQAFLVSANLFESRAGSRPAIANHETPSTVTSSAGTPPVGPSSAGTPSAATPSNRQ